MNGGEVFASPIRKHNHFGAAVFFIAERLVEVRPVLQGSAVRDNEARIDLAILNPFQQHGHVMLHGVCPMRKVRLRLIAEPIGRLSNNPPYIPTIETVPKLRQHWIACRSTCGRSVPMKVATLMRSTTAAKLEVVSGSVPTASMQASAPRPLVSSWM